MPDDISRYYTPNSSSIPTTQAQLEAAAETERFKLEIVQRFVRSGRLLQIGPAWGTFAYPARQAGFGVDAVEMDAGCCEYLTNTVGVRAINSGDVCGWLETAQQQPDVIALWHVIEHLPDPYEVLDAARRLAPDGTIVIAAPDPESLQLRVLGRRWAHIDAPRQLSLIPVGVLERHAGRAGLETCLVTTTDKSGVMMDALGWRQ